MPTLEKNYFPAIRDRYLNCPFENGERMDQKTFHELYETASEDFHAELIDGEVYIKMPVKETHSRLQNWFSMAAGLYIIDLPGLSALDGPTIKLNRKNEPEPDLCIVIKPEWGGQTYIDEKNYLRGTPEYILEISNASRSIDLGKKKRVYANAGVKEYCVVLGLQNKLLGFENTENGFEEIPLQNGILKSRLLPGFWLDEIALTENSNRRLLKTLQNGMASAEFTAFVESFAKPRKAITI